MDYVVSVSVIRLDTIMICIFSLNGFTTAKVTIQPTPSERGTQAQDYLYILLLMTLWLHVFLKLRVLFWATAEPI